LKVTVNGIEIPYNERGYRFKFVEPFGRSEDEMVKRADGSEVQLQVYDNGVIIQNWQAPDGVVTQINRPIAIDPERHIIHILASGQTAAIGEDGSLTINSR
jgi:hypothetical protein